jgi:hypothetical protein
VNDLMVGTLDAGVRYLAGGNGNGASRHHAPSDQSSLIAMDAKADPISMKLSQSPWLASYLLNGAENSFNAFGVNDEIRILLDPKETQKPNLRRVCGQRS